MPESPDAARLQQIRADAERNVHPSWRDIHPTWVLLTEIDRLTAERDKYASALSRVDEEIAEFEAAAADDPDTSSACLHMIELLRQAQKTEDGRG